MAELELIEYIELDLSPCSLSYGVYPCTAVLGVDSTRKCFNSPATCPVPQDYSAGAVRTHRFALASQSLPDDILCIPNIQSINVRAQEAHPGRGVPVRESVEVTFFNHRHNDAGYDDYLAERNYNTYDRGTHWGKFAARWPNIQGAELRHLIGKPTDALANFETRHYYVNNTVGPDGKGIYKIVAKDVFKFFEGKKAQIPKPSSGVLSAAIDDTETALTLSPTGIGDAEYPASGTASIGGEMVTFTRSGDDITLTGRGLLSSTQESHEEDETFQLAEVYTAVDPAEIIDDMIFGTHSDSTAHTDTPLTYRNLAAWQTETDTYFGRLYSAVIARPTPIQKLISELIQQAGLMFYPDIIAETIRLQVLRQGVVVLAVTDDIVKPGSLRFMPQEDKRISAVWTSFGQKNPLLNLDEDGNYKSIAARYDDDPVKLLEALPESIERVRSRWITVENRVAANEFNQLELQRWGDTPGEVFFAVPAGYPIKVGNNITFKSRIFEDDVGDQRAAQPAIVTQVRRTPGWYECKADTIKFRQVDTYPGNTDRVILIDEDAFNVNLRELYDLIYVAPESGDSVLLIINSGVRVGSIYYDDPQMMSTPAPGLTIGDWPTGVTITVENHGLIAGQGGLGAQYLFRYRGEIPAGIYAGWSVPIWIPATDGGVAIYTRVPITIDNTDGQIYGGGGGGGCNEPVTNPQGIWFGSWGGDGAGYLTNTYLNNPEPPLEPIDIYVTDDKLATTSAGGVGGQSSYGLQSDPAFVGDVIGTGLDIGNGGAGGGPGEDGDDGDDNGVIFQPAGPGVQDGWAGGSAGAAVDGDSYVTYTAVGDIKGPQIN